VHKADRASKELKEHREQPETQVLKVDKDFKA